MRLSSRRDFLKLAAGSTVLALSGCGGGGSTAWAAARVADSPSTPESEPLANPASTITSARPKAVREAGREERFLLPGTLAETRMVMTWSGAPGPVLMVLGGVHGNEPGGWLAAAEVANWVPSAGGLIVVPKANVIAAADFVRTYDEIGDLNRLYPGSLASPLLMERMAAEIMAATLEFNVEVLLDMHESWAFYAERSQNGTAFLGQTLTTGIGPRNPDLGHAIVERVNSGINITRDLIIERDGSNLGRDTSGAARPTGRGRSSLAVGGYVDGLTPLLMEMGQQDQYVERRTELHLMVARATMDQLQMS
jgi:hypothetical protein